MRILILIGVLSLVSVARADYLSARALHAIALNESGDDDMAIGDKKLPNHAYGHLQIRQPCVDDVNRKFGTHYCASDCLGNRQLSEWICQEYINMYATKKRLGHTPTDEDKTRIWNGGPDGFKRRSTLSYWQRVKAFIVS